MNLSASFDHTASVTWQEHHRKPLDPQRLQAAMFTDRPDLWPTARPRRRRPAPVPPAQYPLLPPPERSAQQ